MNLLSFHTYYNHNYHVHSLEENIPNFVLFHCLLCMQVEHENILLLCDSVNNINSHFDRSPLPRYVAVPHVVGYPTLSDPRMFKTPIQTPGHNCSTSKPQSSYLSFAPPEVMGQSLRFSLLTFVFWCISRMRSLHVHVDFFFLDGIYGINTQNGTVTCVEGWQLPN